MDRMACFSKGSFVKFLGQNEVPSDFIGDFPGSRDVLPVILGVAEEIYGKVFCFYEDESYEIIEGDE